MINSSAVTNEIMSPNIGKKNSSFFMILSIQNIAEVIMREIVINKITIRNRIAKYVDSVI